MASLLLFLATVPLLGSRPKVRSITLEELWRGSEIVVLGRVEKVEEVIREVPPGNARYAHEQWMYDGSVPIAVVEVQRTLRGSEGLKSIPVFAQRTWTCDVTQAVPGESALFFLERTQVLDREGEKFRHTLADAFGKAEVRAIRWSGRGRMPARDFEGKQVLDFWPEVLMPEDLPVLAGPHRRRGDPADPIAMAMEEEEEAGSVPSVIRSVALEGVAAALEGYGSLEDRPLLAASAFPSATLDLAWDLMISEEGWCRLTIHSRPKPNETFPDPRRDRVRLFRLPGERIRGLAAVLEKEWTSDMPDLIGSATPIAWQRELRRFQRVPTADGGVMRLEKSLKFAPLDAALTPGADLRRQTISALRVWREVRGSFDVPECVDHRPDDARWLE